MLLGVVDHHAGFAFGQHLEVHAHLVLLYYVFVFVLDRFVQLRSNLAHHRLHHGLIVQHFGQAREHRLLFYRCQRYIRVFELSFFQKISWILVQLDITTVEFIPPEIFGVDQSVEFGALLDFTVVHFGGRFFALDFIVASLLLIAFVLFQEFFVIHLDVIFTFCLVLLRCTFFTYQ